MTASERLADTASPTRHAARVLQIGTGSAAVFAGALLARVGAHVTRATIGRPERAAEDDLPGLNSATELLAHWYGRDMRHIAVPNLEGLLPLVEDFDVVIDGLEDEDRTRIGDPERLEALAPTWIVVTPHGLAPEPVRGSDLSAVASSGAMWAIGRPDRVPLTIPFEYSSSQTGVVAATLALAATHSPDAPGLVDVATVDVVGCYAGLNAMLFVWEREGHRAAGSGGAYPYTLLPCADGSVCLAARTNADWHRILEVLGSPPWAADERFGDVRVNALEHADELDALITESLSALSRGEVLGRAESVGAPIAPVRTVHEIGADADLRRLGAIESFDSGDRLVPMPDAPWLRALAASPPISRERRRSWGPESEWQPLRGVRVLDFGWVVSGSFAGLFAAALGADVIKIESRQRADNLRLRGAMRDGAIDWARADNVPLHHALNRGKRSFGVHLKRGQGREVLGQLIAASDAIIENFSVGALERMGFPDDVLQSLNASLIRVSLTPAGRTGPGSSLRGYAATTGALAGLEGLVGYPGAEQPTGMLNFGVADYAAGAMAAFTLVAAVCGGDEGFRSLDAAQTLATTVCLGPAFAADAVGWSGFEGNSDLFATFQDVFVARDKGYVAVTAVDEADVRTLAAVTASPAGGTASDIRAHVGEWVATQARDGAVCKLQAGGVRAAPVLTMAEHRAHDRHAARASEVTVVLPDGTEANVPRMPWVLPHAPAAALGRGPKLGEHTAQICRDVIGLDDREIAALVGDGVLELGQA